MTERVVFKYPIDGPRYGIHTGANPRILHVGNQREQLTVWIEQDTGNQQAAIVAFAVFGTGQLLSPDREYIGTVVMAGGDLVWHVYANIRPGGLDPILDASIAARPA